MLSAEALVNKPIAIPLPVVVSLEPPEPPEPPELVASRQSITPQVIAIRRMDRARFQLRPRSCGHEVTRVVEDAAVAAGGGDAELTRSGNVMGCYLSPLLIRSPEPSPITGTPTDRI